MRRPVPATERPPVDRESIPGPATPPGVSGNGDPRGTPRTVAATAARSERRGDTWFWWFIGAVTGLACAAMVLPKLFWWFTIAAATLMFAGALVEGFYDWKHARPLRRPREEEPPEEALAATRSTRTGVGEE